MKTLPIANCRLPIGTVITTSWFEINEEKESQLQINESPIGNRQSAINLWKHY
jgi:hypothetical protein